MENNLEWTIEKLQKQRQRYRDLFGEFKEKFLTLEKHHQTYKFYTEKNIKDLVQEKKSIYKRMDAAIDEYMPQIIQKAITRHLVKHVQVDQSDGRDRVEILIDEIKEETSRLLFWSGKERPEDEKFNHKC